MTKHIIEFKDDSQLDELDSMIADKIFNKIYLLTKGIPFCCAKIEHSWELFHGTGTGTKKEECKSCKLISWCNYNSEQFKIKAITHPNKDLLKFLEERDENINDWI